ncbi:MAG: hypothetical protein SFU57_01065 [Gemmatimonadales bacterium]|nr:hypothetical protein [Gemmatimonadales bacterium]
MKSSRMLPASFTIWRIRPDGSGLEQIPTPFESSIGGNFDVSSSGRWLAVNESSDILVIPVGNPDGWVDITFDKSTLGDPRWHPNETSVLATYLPQISGPITARLTARDRSWQMELMERPISSTFLIREWFAGGDSLWYRSTPEGGAMVFRLSDSSSHPLSAVIDNRNIVAVSRTGRRALSWDTNEELYPDIHWWIHDLPSGAVVLDTILPFSPFEAIWSPDERFIAFGPSTVVEGIPEAEFVIMLFDTNTRTFSGLVPTDAQFGIGSVRWIK